MKIAVVSLGCPKNQVDADVFCRALLSAGHETAPSVQGAQLVIINTCGFIQSAKEEAIEYILDVCAVKKQNPALKVVVCGCLAERYRHEVVKEFPEVDAVVGIGENGRLPAIVKRLEEAGPKRGKALACFSEKENLPLSAPRVISTPPHYAWLKIAEGCQNRCTYCAIPAIRGPLRSRTQSSILAEAGWLAEQGVKELVLVAQDVTAYGEDTGENKLCALLRKLNGVRGLRWIRLLYAYPERITQELLGVMAGSKKIVPYIDLPVQHSDDAVLKAMGRRGGAKAVRRAVELVREKLPGAVLRTTLICGFPGESETQFEALCNFVSQTQFERLGCFAFSPEEGTPAERMPNQVPPEECQRRANRIMELQQYVMEEKGKKLLGTDIVAVCDAFDGEQGRWMCRGWADAPEIDGAVWLPRAAPLRPGGFYKVRVTQVNGCDCEGEYLSRA